MCTFCKSIFLSWSSPVVQSRTGEIKYACINNNFRDMSIFMLYQTSHAFACLALFRVFQETHFMSGKGEYQFGEANLYDP